MKKEKANDPQYELVIDSIYFFEFESNSIKLSKELI